MVSAFFLVHYRLLVDALMPTTPLLLFLGSLKLTHPQVTDLLMMTLEALVLVVLLEEEVLSWIYYTSQ
jgi:hypothetical protein